MQIKFVSMYVQMSHYSCLIGVWSSFFLALPCRNDILLKNLVLRQLKMYFFIKITCTSNIYNEQNVKFVMDIEVFYELMKRFLQVP